jgi:hypothetical protein
MLASNPSTVIDICRLLPPEGEADVSFEYDGFQLRVVVGYEDESDASLIRRVAILFDGVALMHVSSVPGVELLEVQYTGKHDIRNVVEYTNSEAANAWSAHFGWAIRHFHVYFANQNNRLDVFAKKCGVEP